MKVIKPRKLALVTRCFENERRFFLSLGVLTLHRFTGAMEWEAAIWPFLAQELGKDALADAGLPKPRAEYLVSGHAFAGPAPRSRCKVRVQLGDLQKELQVFGDRFWEKQGLREAPSDPEPFEQMPITWEKAFGGQGFARNPLGKGSAPVEDKRRPLHPLPNIELPSSLIRSKEELAEPAGLGPIDLMWPQRLSKAGTHDDRWLKERFPGFAADMDWSIFNLAPEDQQQPEPFRGDEAFAISGMHPRQARLKGQLPGIAARCFVNQRRAEGVVLGEVGMRLTTVWFFPHAERYLLVFHGQHEIAEEDAADVLHAVVAAEQIAEGKPTRHYERVLAQRLDPDRGAVHALRDDDLLPALPGISGGEDEAVAEMTALLQTEGLLRKHQRANVARDIQKSREFLVSLGLDPDLHGPAPLPPEEAPPTIDELLEVAEKAKGDPERLQEELAAQKAEREAKLRPLLEAEGLDADAILAEPDQPPAGPPEFSAEKEIARLRTLAAECRVLGTPVEELDRYTEDPERRKMLEEAEESLREGYRQMAHHQGAAPRFSGDDAARSRAAALATLAQQGSLARLNLTGFDLSGLDLRGIDLSGAWLENANLARANLEGANLSEAVLTRADLTDANLTRANLCKANLGLAEIVRTRADGAILSEAILGKARIEGVDLREARLDAADLMEATISVADLSGASLPGLVFRKTRLQDLSFRGADLTNCVFLEVDLQTVDFSGACLEKATFLGVKAGDAAFIGARLVNASFVQECSFENSNFREAILAPANLRGTRLAGSDFSAARLTRADLSECDLTGANLQRADALEARFVKANLSGAVLVSANLMNAVLQNADLTGADLSGANLFQADLARVRLDDRTLFRNANRKKARLLPERAAS